MRLIVLFLIYILPLYSQMFSLSMDDDYVFNSDNRYTGGMQMGWMSDTYDENNITNLYVAGMGNIVSSLKLAEFGEKYQTGNINIQEICITPENLRAREPLYNDVPYAGIALINFSFFLWDIQTFEEFKLSIGAIGPMIGMQEIQKTIHKLTASTAPEGWHNQLGDKAILQAGYLKGIKQYEMSFSNGMKYEWFNSYFLDAGNFYTGAGFGSTIRYGYNMPNNFTQMGSLLNNSQNDQLNLDTYDKSWGWSVYTGIALDGIGYLYYFDEAKRLGYTLDRVHFIPRGKVGIDFYTKEFRLSVELFPVGASTSSFQANSFGRVNFTWQFK